MKAILRNVREEAEGIKSFQWETEEKLTYRPGMWNYITLSELKYEDERGPKRHFTISSSPTESLIQFTTKLSESGYKKTLWEAPIGIEVELRGPFGSFVLDENDTSPRVFLAGGIGITPFRSMLKYIQDKNLNTPVTLIYSNKIPEEIAFRQELESMNGILNIKIVMTVTKPEDSKIPWNGVTGRVSEQMIKEQVPNWQNSSLWVCGPPAMVEAMVETGQKMGFAADKIKSEEFTGY